MHKFKLLGIMGTLFATLLVGSLMVVPAFAKQSEAHNKTTVCHYQDEVGADNTPIGWYEITINDHALKAHLDVHGPDPDGDLFDKAEADYGVCDFVEGPSSSGRPNRLMNREGPVEPSCRRFQRASSSPMEMAVVSRFWTLPCTRNGPHWAKPLTSSASRKG